MTKHDLKELAAMGAELGAAKAENEKLRKALKRIIDRCEAFVDDEAEMRTPSVEVLMGIAEDAIYTVHEADVALSHQAEPTDTYTAVDMATAAAQGFRDGQAAVEQSPAQDEREAPVVVATAILGGIYHGGSGPELGEIDIEVCMPALEALQCETVNSSDDVFLPLMSVAQHERIVAALTRPAQTEQHPVAWQLKLPDGRVALEKAFPSWAEGGDGYEIQPLYSAPIAQTAPHDALYAPGIAEQLERTDWTPEEALRWYAEGKHFDTVNGRTRIIDSGAIASNALKHLSLPYLEMKGDAELSELRTQTAPQPEHSALVEALKAMLETYGPPAAVADKCTYPADHPITKARAALSAPIPQTSPQPERDREADRARFPDPVFNTWLDEGISDAGHTVWDQVNVCDAWAGWENRQWYTAPQHTDDEAVDRFAAAMKAKLAASRAKGRGGWDDASVCTVEFLAQLLVEHLGKGNAGTFEDVANFAMMLHQRGADPRVLALAVTPQPEQNRLDTQRLEFMVSQRALVNSQNGTASPTVYRVCWPSESRQQADWYPSERDAIDAAMAAKEA
jgi:hypothetical protein